MNSLRIIFAGSGAFGLPTLRALASVNYQIAQVITQPDRPAGRGRKLTPTPIGEFAMAHNLPLIRTKSINSLQLPPADVMVVIAFGQKIAPHQVNQPKLGSVNLHASLLPKYRGAAPINWAILNGENETGNSVIRLAEKMDAGAVLGQSRVAIGELETAGELHDRLAENGAMLILTVLDDLANGTANEKPQNESLATIAPKLSRQSAAVNFHQPAEKVALQIRGLYPWPGCRARLIHNGDERARITLVRAVRSDNPGEAAKTPGEITSAGAVSCSEGELKIVELQPEGKGSMSLASYQNGHQWPAGAKIEPLS